MGWTWPVYAVVLLGWGAGAAAQVPDQARPRPTTFETPVWIQFEGPINHRLSLYLRSRLHRAQQLGADLIVLEINSPGGLAIESVELAELLRDSPAYTVAYVPRQALSGAAILCLGADWIVAAPTATIGDIGAIHLDPTLFAFRFAPAKIYSVLVRQARDLATSKHHPADLAEAMIDKDILVYQRLNAQGEIEFLTRRHEVGRLETQIAGGWELVEESGPERFLTLSGNRAQQLGLVGAVADDASQLDQLLHVSTPYRRFEYGLTDTLVYLLNTWFVTLLLILIGLVALYIEFSSPGIGVGGLIAALCAVLFFWSRFLAGTSGVLEILLFLAGLGFLLVELFVIPGWGLAGFLGLCLLFVSAIMAGNDFVIPRSEAEFSQLLGTVAVVLVASLCFLIVAGQITRRLGYLPFFNRLVLNPPAPGGDGVIGKLEGKGLPQPHPTVSVGDWGTTDSLLRPAGRVRFGARSLDVVSDGSFIEPGRRVRVIQIEGNRIVVEEMVG